MESAAAVAATARDAVRDADVVVTAASFGPVRQVMTEDWLAPDALVVPVDYATVLRRGVAPGRRCSCRQREQFLANRDAGNFDGYPDPTATIGEAIVGGHAATARAVSSSATSASAWPTSCSVLRSSTAPSSAAWAWSCRRDAASVRSGRLVRGCRGRED
jgi:hypothetical protein